VYDPTQLATILNQLPDRPPKQIPVFCYAGGLVFPYRNLEGEVNCFARVRPHCPPTKDGKPSKYMQPKGSPLRAYFPEASLAKLRDGESPIYITEGEKKALALSQLGLASVGIGGFWCGCKKVSTGGHELIDDLAAIPWKGRIAYVVFDYDRNPQTRRKSTSAARRLAAELHKVGVKEVYYAELPPGPDGDKQGVDDYLVANGSDAFRKLVEAAKTVPQGSGAFSNFKVVEIKDEKGKNKNTWIGLSVRELHDSLFQLTGGWPKRTGKLLFITEGYEARWLEQTNQTFAWIGGRLDEPVKWANGTDKVSQGVFDAYLRQAVENYEAVESLPHYPSLSGHYYLHPPPTGGDGRAFDALLGRFHPETEIDRALIRSAFLTAFWGGEPGSRPAFLVESEDDDGEGGRGTGKTTIALSVGRLAGGHFDVQTGDDFSKVITRLLTPSALTQRIALLDNVKTLRFSWADLEGLITNDTISGHQMYVGDGRRPNTLTWFLTLNNASLSKDMAKRCVIIRVKRPPYSPTWKADTWKFIDENRWAIVGDILACLSKNKPALAEYSRWGAWEQEVLACVPNAYECQSLIEQRQAAVDGDQEDSDLIRAAFVTELRDRGHEPDKEVIFIPSKEAATVVNQASGENRPTQRATAHLQTLNIRELRKSNGIDGSRGFRWTGHQSAPGQHAVMLKPSQVAQIASSLNAKRKKGR